MAGGAVLMNRLNYRLENYEHSPKYIVVDNISQVFCCWPITNRDTDTKHTSPHRKPRYFFQS
jgi:hypothetical protein